MGRLVVALVSASVCAHARFGDKESAVHKLGTIGGSSPQLCESLVASAAPQMFPAGWQFDKQRESSDCQSGFAGEICEDCPDVAIQTIWSSADRPSLWRNIVSNLVRSTYPGNLRLVVLDQSPTPSAALKGWIERLDNRGMLAPNRRVDYYFVRAPTKASHVATGAARNLNSRLCAGSDVVLVMDSDDFFGRAYVSNRVSAWLRSGTGESPAKRCTVPTALAGPGL